MFWTLVFNTILVVVVILVYLILEQFWFSILKVAIFLAIFLLYSQWEYQTEVEPTLSKIQEMENKKLRENPELKKQIEDRWNCDIFIKGDDIIWRAR